MKTTLKTNITVKDICEGFVYNELEGKGLFGLSYSKADYGAGKGKQLAILVGLNVLVLG